MKDISTLPDTTDMALVVVDAQEGFVKDPETTNLYNISDFDDVSFKFRAQTKFINDEESPVYRYVPYVKMQSGESGVESILDVKGIQIAKNGYGTKGVLTDYLKSAGCKKTVLVGAELECCLLSIAFELFDQGIEVFILLDYCDARLDGDAYWSYCKTVLPALFGRDHILKGRIK